MIKITFLGTGTSQGIPVIGSDHPVSFSKDLKDKRLRSSILIEYNNLHFTIDCGPDFRQQMLRANCKKLDGIIFTHEHADHTTGIDDVTPFFFRQGKIPIFLNKRVLESLNNRFAYIFDPSKKYPGAPDFEVNIINKDVIFLVSFTSPSGKTIDLFMFDKFSFKLLFKVGDLNSFWSISSKFSDLANFIKIFLKMFFFIF